MLRAFSLLVALLCGADAYAQSWPAKPIRIVNPYPAGSTADVLVRTLQPIMEQRLGQRIVIESKTGAGGNIGAEAVAQSAPDGYTLLFGATNNFAINEFLMPGTPPARAFTPITQIVDMTEVIYVNSDLPVKTLNDFVAYARANPGKLNYGSSGAGAMNHIGIVLLQQQTGIDVVHVPYRGVAPAVAAAAAGELQFIMGALVSGKSQLDAGKLRAIAVTSNERLAALPGVPTTPESGFPDYIVTNWFAFAGPANMPREIAERVAAEVRFALQDPQVRARLNEMGFQPIGNTPDQFAAAIAKEAPAWERVIKSANIKAE